MKKPAAKAERPNNSYGDRVTAGQPKMDKSRTVIGPKSNRGEGKMNGTAVGWKGSRTK